MKKGITALLLCITIIFMLAYIQMNRQYDKLSRYPYQDEESRKLIKQYLADDEIDYIIEYSIAPSLFIKFIAEKNFNIYHAKQYFELSQLAWELNTQQIVEIIELSDEQYTVEQLAEYLENYRYDEFVYFLKNHDSYNPESSLLINAGSIEAYIDDNHTISMREPFHLMKLSSDIIETVDSNIQVDAAVVEPLKQLCIAISEALQLDNCANLQVTSGYISYYQQQNLYAVAKDVYQETVEQEEFMPGHSEHQLGLAIDLNVKDVIEVEFRRTLQYEWLLNNAYRFGFIQTYGNDALQLYNKKPQWNHFRYIGVHLATYLNDNSVTLYDVHLSK